VEMEAEKYQRAGVDGVTPYLPMRLSLGAGERYGRAVLPSTWNELAGGAVRQQQDAPAGAAGTCCKMAPC
jgi:hypothetical protein